MLLAVALAYERLHRDAAAIEYYEVFLERSRPHEAALSEKWRRRQEYVRRTVERLQTGVMATRGRLSVATSPPGAAIFVDGARAGVEGAAVAPFAVFAKPGTHNVMARLDGFEDAELTVSVSANRFQPVWIEMREHSQPAEPSAPRGEVPAALRETAPAPQSGGSEPLPWVLIGTGSALAVASAGLVVGVAETARQQRGLVSGEAARWDALEDRRVAMLVSSVALGAGGLALLGVGIHCAVGGCGGGADEREAEAELLGLGVRPVNRGVVAGAVVAF